MTLSEQITAVRSTQFFSDLRARLLAIHAATVTERFKIEGSILIEISGVPVRATFTGSGDVHVVVGVDEHENPLYEWSAPASWVS